MRLLLLTRIELGADLGGKSVVDRSIPDNYQGLSFKTWLDIFLEYALCLSRYGGHREAYDICEAAKDAIVFCHSHENNFLIHVCWGGK